MIDTFHFLRPVWLVALLPSAWLVWRLLQHHSRGSTWQQACDPHLLPFLLVGRDTNKQIWPLYALALAWVVGIIALAGPTWSQLPQPLYRAKQTRVFVLDLSKSMDATDIRPNRITRARFKLLDMLKQSREGQTALVAFAGSAFTVTPLTDDSETIAALVPTLVPDLMPSQGSQLDAGLRLAGDVLRQAGAHHGEVIVMSDGTEDTSAAMAAATSLAHDGHRVQVIAVGTSQGGPVPVDGGGFLKDSKAAIVIPQVNHQELQQIATAGAGAFTPLTDDDSDLRRILTSTPRETATQENGGSRHTAQWREEGPWLVLALLPVAAAAFRRGWLAVWIFVPLLLPPMPAYAFEWQSWFARPDQQGARALERGDAAAASQLFENPSWRASAHYRAGNYDAAAKEFATINTAEGRYNYGNALAKLGKLPEALQAYNEALAQAPNHADAKQNRDLVQKLIKEQEKQQQSKNGKNSPPESSSQSKPEQGDSNDEQPQKPDQSDSQSNKNESQQANTQHTDDPAQADAGSNGVSQDTPTASKKNDQHQATPTQKADRTSDDKDKNKDSTPEQLAASESPDSGQAQDEKNQAMEQWLRRIEDDPGGLLRRKFIRDLQRQGRQAVPGHQAW